MKEKQSAQHLTGKVTTLLFLMLAVLPMPARATGKRTAVVVAEAPGINAVSLATVRALTEDETERQGRYVVRDRALPLLSPPSAQRTEFAARRQIDAFFELRLLRIGQKIVVVLHERGANNDHVRHSARLTARTLEEIDVVVPRLVRALITRQTPERTQRIDNVTRTEARKHRKRAGEFLWGVSTLVGSPMGSGAGAGYGAELRFAYEMPHVRLNWDIGGTGGEDVRGEFLTTISAHYLPFAGNFSPFIGGGMGIAAQGGGDFNSKVGAALMLSGGAEMFRLHGVRLIAELRVTFPLFRLEQQDWDGWDYAAPTDPPAEMFWSPTGTFALSLLW